MNVKYFVAAAAAAAVMLSAGAQAATQAEADAAIKAAKSAQASAAAVKWEWRDTGSMIKAAEKAAAGGDFAKAMKLANAAEQQGHNAVAQSKGQVGVGNPGYLY